MSAFDEDVSEMKAIAEEVLQMYVRPDPWSGTSPEDVITAFWEYSPPMLVGVMREWWFKTKIPRAPVSVYLYEISTLAADFVDAFCDAMALGNEEVGYTLARKFVGEATLTEMQAAMAKVAECVLEIRAEAS